MFEDALGYDCRQLDYNRRRQVKLASDSFEIRPIPDNEEFKRKAFPVYLSFYERTQYQYGSRRRNPAFFARWADALFDFPQAVVLGGYRNGELGGVSVTLLVEDTLLYSMFFCDTPSLRLYLSDLMLHFVREKVAEQKCAQQIFVGMYKGGNGLDNFYLLRGCKLVQKPAYLYLSPIAAFILKRFMPRQYAQLAGEIADKDRKYLANNAKEIKTESGKQKAEMTGTRSV